MGKVKLYAAISIDGFIADGEGGVGWLEDEDFMSEGEDFGYMEFYNSIGITLMGNATYQQVLGFDVPFPYPDKKNYVFSRKLEGTDEHVSFINESPIDFIQKLKETSKEDYLVNRRRADQFRIDEC